jgi:glycosyltransferase involved in cell wall biosynthesis
MTDPSISVVVPIYNSQDTLPSLVERVSDVLRGITSQFEIILVNDGSRDDSWTVIERLSEQHDVLRGINLMRNYGQHNALLAGIRTARHELILTIDDDLQNPPEEIPRLLEEIDRGADVVYGTPRAEKHSMWRVAASQITKLALQNAMGADTARKISAFRIFRTQLRDAFKDYNGEFISIDVLLTWGTKRFASVAVRHDERAVGTSNYTFGKLITHALNMITGFTVLPLQLASTLGFVFSLFGIMILVYVVVRVVFYGNPVPGFPFLASVVAIFSGVTLFALGIIGEYLARMHFRLMNRPPYAVRDTVGVERSISESR